MVDWLLEVHKKFKIDDLTVVFQAVNLMDRFYDHFWIELPVQDLQLTAVTALLIASKNL
jgi:hypothetical protein